MIYKLNDIAIDISEKSNSEIFNKLTESDLVKPKVPEFYYEQRGIYVENPDHPVYAQAMEIYELQKMKYSSNIALLLAMPLNLEILDMLRTITKYKVRNLTNEQIWLDYLNTSLSNNDKMNIINATFLTENRVFDIFNILATSVHRGNSEITEARLKNAINSQIYLDNIIIFGLQLVHPLDEFNTAIDANLNWIQWSELTNEKRAELIALNRLRTIVKNHSEDEMAIEMEKRSKQK